MRGNSATARTAYSGHLQKIGFACSVSASLHFLTMKFAHADWEGIVAFGYYSFSAFALLFLLSAGILLVWKRLGLQERVSEGVMWAALLSLFLAGALICYRLVIRQELYVSLSDSEVFSSRLLLAFTLGGSAIWLWSPWCLC